MIVVDFGVDVSTRWYETNVLRHQHSERDKRSFPTALRASFCKGFTLVLNLSRALEAFICLLALYLRVCTVQPSNVFFLHNTLIQIVFILAVEYTNLAGERHNLRLMVAKILDENTPILFNFIWFGKSWRNFLWDRACLSLSALRKWKRKFLCCVLHKARSWN